MDDSTFASRKSSLRAFIWYMYIHFTKNITYWFSHLEYVYVISALFQLTIFFLIYWFKYTC